MSVTVPEADLLAPHAACPVCKRSGRGRRLVALQQGPDVDLVECMECHAASADRLPTSRYLESLYDPRHYSSSLVSDDRLSERCARSILAEVDVDPDRPVSIVDYGGADGTLSRVLRAQLLARGHRASVRSTIVDLFPRPDTEHQDFVTPDQFAASPGRHDLLLASAVLEHLPDPGRAIRALVDHASPEAYLYARTPYDAPLHRAVPGYRVKWPRHLHDMGPAYWDQFIDQFELDAELLVSRPSIVETSVRQATLRTIAAHVLKAPGHLEARVLRPLLGYRSRMWRWVGGWEVIVAWRRGT